MKQIPLSNLIAKKYSSVYHALINNTYNRLQLSGGRGGAKGDAIYTIVSLILSTSDEPMECRVFVPLSKNISKGVQEQIKKVLERAGIVSRLNLSQHTFTFDNGSRIIIGGLYASGGSSNELENGADTSLSGGIRFMILDELQTLRDFELVTKLEGTFARHENLQTIEISNPPNNRMHPLAKRYEMNEQDDNCLCIHSTVYDIPREWVGERLYQLAELWKETDYQKYEHEMLGKMVGLEGLVINGSNLQYVEQDYNFQFKTNFAVVDTKTTGNDYMALTIIGITLNNQIVLRDVLFRNDILTDKLMLEMCNIINAYNCSYTFIETNKDYAIALFMQKRIKNRTEKFHTTQNKHEKILMYASDIQNTIVYKTNDNEYNEFIEQMLMYDKNKDNNKGIHDDAIDNMAMVYKLIVQYKNSLGVNNG